RTDWTPVASRIEVFAPAKINLFLHVGDRRPDGFHDLESLVVFVDAGDRLTFEPADALTLRIDGPFGTTLATDDDNLVLRVAATLGSDVPVCVDSRTAWMEGRGEVVSPVTGLPPVWLVLANPGVAVPTGAVFKALRSRTGVGKARRDGCGADAHAL